MFCRDTFPDPTPHSVEHLLRGKKIILYGAGVGCTIFCLFVLQKRGLHPSAILDRRFTSREIRFGVPACHPSAYTPTEDERKNTVVVVTVGKTEYHGDIFACLRGLGFESIVLSSDIYEYYLLCPPAELDSQGLDYYVRHKESICRALDLLADEPSRGVFLRILQMHLQRIPLRIPDRPPAEQYFPKDIAIRKGYSRFVNCGAYRGDTVLHLHSLVGKIDALACFEPDQDNFAALSDLLRSKRETLADELLAFPCGVFSHETQLRFSGGNQLNSVISDHGESLIQCVALDHVIPNLRPTFIQMDIEGAEPEGLQGAEGIIREHQPALAVCVYHSPPHLWEIPLYLHGLKLGYRFYLRNYTSYVFDTVLYATT